MWQVWNRPSTSYRADSYDRERRQAGFTEKLTGREIASAGHLSAKDFPFADEITADNGRLNFYLENSFDVDRVFGTYTAKGDDWLNVYANYDMAFGQVCDVLEVDLHRADGREESMEYRLNAVEKAALSVCSPPFAPVRPFVRPFPAGRLRESEGVYRESDSLLCGICHQQKRHGISCTGPCFCAPGYGGEIGPGISFEQRLGGVR